MALSKEVTSDSGAVSTYHRIASIDTNFSERKAKVIVHSYISEDMRDQEKHEAEGADDAQAQVDELNQLVANPTDENEARRIELTGIINNRGSSTNNPVERKLTSTEVTINFDDPDFSIADVYGWLKQTPEFADAEDA